MYLNNGKSTYNLQQIRQELLKLDLEQSSNLGISKFNPRIQKLYGLFGSDNTFTFVKQNNNSLIIELLNLIMSVTFLTSAYDMDSDYYLTDFLSRTTMSDKQNVEYGDGDIYEYNGNEYCVTSLSKIIPASNLGNLSVRNMYMIQDKINAFLYENPDFVNQVFFRGNFSEERKHSLAKSRKPFL